MGDPSAVFGIIHDSLKSNEPRLTVTELCQIAGVSRSGYYNWVKTEPTRLAKEEADRKDFELILDAFNFRGYKKGVRSIYMRLLRLGIKMNPKKIRRLMHKFNLYCPIRKPNPYRQMAKAMKTNRTADNLLNREFETHGARMVLLTDITYIPYSRESRVFAYLSTVLDAFTKEVLAYVLSPGLEVDFVLETVQILIRDHGISLTSETIIHSDQGCHYTSVKFIEIVNDSNLRQSMSRRGNCWDNAPQESFFGHMKDELRDKMKAWETFEDVKKDVDDWMDYYNNDRCIWKLAKLPPRKYYEYLKTGKYPKPEQQEQAASRGSAP